MPTPVTIRFAGDPAALTLRLRDLHVIRDAGTGRPLARWIFTGAAALTFDPGSATSLEFRIGSSMPIRRTT